MSSKRNRAFFHTIHLPLLRLLIPSLFIVVFGFAFLTFLNHRDTITLPHAPMVMIDPGHGGYDPGVRDGTLHEADLTLAIGKELKKALEAKGISAAMTREGDTDFADSGSRGKSSKRTDLDQRIELTERSQAQLFISLHVNNSSLATRGGAEVFYNDKTPGAKDLALEVQSYLHKLPNMSKREAKNADYYLLRNQSIPALIIECGYLNIGEEKARLISPEYQAQLAKAIADGIESYLHKKEARSK